MAIKPPFHPAILWRAALPRSQREHVNSMDARYAEAIDDIVSGLRMHDMWGRLGWAEVKRRYRRTMIGPFWSSLSLAVFVAALGIVWSQLWKLNIQEYLPFLTSGLICWLLFSAFVTEGCAVFISNESLIKQLRISYMMLVCALVWRNMIVFLHNLAIYIPIGIYGGIPVNMYTLAAIPGLIAMCVNGMWAVLMLGLLCARYRDIQQIVSSLLQVSMFVTPILWSSDQLTGRSRILVDYNLLYHTIEIIRDPLMGKPPSAWSWFMVILTAIAGWSFTLYLFARFRRRIPYWL